MKIESLLKNIGCIKKIWFLKVMGCFEKQAGENLFDNIDELECFSWEKGFDSLLVN